MIFKRNDRVVYAQKDLFNSPYYGLAGTVVGVHKKHRHTIYVKFDKIDEIAQVNDCNLEPLPEVSWVAP